MTDFPNFLSASALMQHPRFDDAVAVLTDALDRLHGEDPRLVRPLFEYDRAVTFMLTICLAMNEQDDVPATWLDVGAIGQAAAVMGIGPERRVRRFVQEMRQDGYLLETPMPGDRRRQRLHPSERMLAIDRAWVAAFHQPLSLLMPEVPRYRAGAARDADYHRAYRKAAIGALRVARRDISTHPAVDSFLHQANGARVLTALMRATRDTPDGWTPPGFFSAAGETTATTRVHVRSMMRNAAAAGYVDIVETPQVRVRPTQRLRDDYCGWAAASLSSTDLVSVLAVGEAGWAAEGQPSH